MNFLTRVSKGIGWVSLVGVFAWGISGPPVMAGNGAEEESGVMAAANNYSSLPGLVAMVSGDAMERFYDFFGSEPVMVEPFTVLDEVPVGKVSILGATLADQMTAVINNEGVAQPYDADEGHGQLLQGVLQEIDGYLRIHMSGRNSRGEWRSYVVNVEMSEPIYRALHSYVAM